ncbi:ERCC4-like helicase domain-containing protein [Cryptosporidium ubiquitum]|uniref:ERCC4-like helicase domain-containing protein n=1 Tax=Cryptosporidium ubiquitum TaxID=857276 RepID=A0A1J4MH00_9CRYT|nr:ERCC4-like helicase domain-containing protein [Cryptosporidium ubiquitum]OII72125.1 ERCC4-like helicase domain-containing protein [Cryptosporidium ubiquitum]
MQLLPFQKSIQNDIDNHKSCLIILSKGLGVFNVVYNYLSKIEINAGNSIFILNLSISEIDCFRLFVQSMDQRSYDGDIDQFKSNTSLLSNKIVNINSEMNLNKRKVFYNKGGIYIITSRILLTDLLSERLNFSNIDGIILINAESLNVRNWNDAFILQLYKSKNPNGFIKGISQRPEILNQGYFGPGIAMRYLGTTDLFLYPRNNVIVEDSFKLSQKIKVIEKSVKASEYFYTIQKCIKVLLEKGLDQILKLDPNIEVTLCDLLYSSSKKLKNKIELLTHDLWCKMTPKLRQITKDILYIRNLLELLYLLDASEFFVCLEYIQSSKLIDKSWMLTKEFETLYKVSRSRIFKINERNINYSSGTESPFSLSLEVNPVHIQLIDIILNIGKELTENDISALTQESNLCDKLLIKENEVDLDCDLNSSEKNIDLKIDGEIIDEEIDNAENDLDKIEYLQTSEKNIEVCSKILENSNLVYHLPEYRVLLIVPDEFCLTITEIEFLLLNGPQNFSAMKLIEIFQNIELNLTPNFPNIISKIIPSFGVTINSNEKFHCFNQLRLVLSKLIQNSSGTQYPFSSKDTTIKSIPNLNIYRNKGLDEIITNNRINPKIIITHPSVNVQGKFWNILSLNSPHLIIMLDPDISLLREIELFTAISEKKTELPLQVIMITIQNSIRHEKLLNTIKNEELSWISLERHKKTLVVPLSDITEGEILTKLNFSSICQDRPENENIVQRVIVDIREFRSSLPYQLFCKGIKIIPMSLEIGDYVISRDVCIERKSLPDLINSLNNGRLFTQLQWISKHYSVPVILIELNNLTELLNHQGIQQSFSPIKSNSKDIYLRLILLMRHFPNIKFIWSSNSSFSSLIILHIKNNREQPNLKDASALNTGIINVNYNDAPSWDKRQKY